MTVTWADFGGDDGPAPNWSDTDASNPIAERFRANLLTVDQLRAVPPSASIIQGVLDENRLTILFGPAKSGKSFITLSWALSITTGSWWLGKHITTPGTVLYVAAEGSAGLAARIDSWLLAENLHDPGLFHVERHAVNLTSPGDVAGFIEVAKEVAPKLIVIDTLARCMVGADENSARDIGVVVQHLEQIREATSASVVAVHHSGKAGGIRGSSAFEGAVDMLYSVAKDDKTVNLERTRAKDGPDGIRWRLSLVPFGRSLALQRLMPQPSDHIPDGAVILLGILAELDPHRNGIARSEWAKACPPEIPERMFGRFVGGLSGRGWVQELKAGNSVKFRVSDAGLAALATEAQHLSLGEEPPDEEPF